jgi:hypothetical protein
LSAASARKMERRVTLVPATAATHPKLFEKLRNENIERIRLIMRKAIEDALARPDPDGGRKRALAYHRNRFETAFPQCLTDDTVLAAIESAAMIMMISLPDRRAIKRSDMVAVREVKIVKAR